MLKTRELKVIISQPADLFLIGNNGQSELQGINKKKKKKIATKAGEYPNIDLFYMFSWWISCNVNNLGWKTLELENIELVD